MAVPVPVPVPTKALGVGDAGAAQPRVLDSEDEPPVAVAVAVAPDLCHGGGRPAAVVAVSAVTATTATLQSVEVDHGGGPVHGGPQNEEDGEDEGPEEPASTEAERVRRQFENAFEVHGLKHVCDNLLGSVLAGLSFWGGLLHRLRALEVLLSRVYYRERFQAVCMDSAPPLPKVPSTTSAQACGVCAGKQLWNLFPRSFRWSPICAPTGPSKSS